MPTIPIIYFLIPYALVMVVFIFFSIFNVYHLMRYGIYNFNLYILSVIYVGGTLFIIGASYIVLSDFDWSVPLSLGTYITPDQDLFQPVL